MRPFTNIRRDRIKVDLCHSTRIGLHLVENVLPCITRFSEKFCNWNSFHKNLYKSFKIGLYME